ncbi:MAG: hypothetical protein CUN49_11550 [Candidatus Thermofonsia Clade 1 bacterium]|uniref:Intracellular proteinase inhibitor BsuPI domain-containing protein n=1 Tax=Candidatus Thermofonsia Clade 1 bacterium TaxID=2364210 RepID=A0A2M8PCG4_9CHLR|nr:MAG: hypothetical protein CUN49_11550 [Candidatus Thermofonsia Clade 1 bacterium]RMF49069.1 MAG: hypothetical protein D6749_14080 [Chloroflexota bacterium]
MKFLAPIILVLLLSACSGSSEATRIVEADNISLRATLSYYQALDPTMTAQANIWTSQIATLQADLNQAREQVTRLTVQMNTGAVGVPPVAAPTTDPNSFATINTPAPLDFSSAAVGAPTPIGVAAASANTPLRTSSGMIIERVVTARGMNNADGCPVDETNAFSTSDSRVWVIAVVRNYKRGTTFSAQWQGNNLEESYQWTANQSGAQICVHFYYEISSLTPGNYTVTFSAQESNGERVQSLPLAFIVR